MVRRRMRIERSDALAALWGAAEATVFFVVPDVLLSWVPLHAGIRRGMVTCLFALAGALVGAVVTWTWALADIGTVRVVFASLPAITDVMIADVRSQLAGHGATALFVGPLTGTPYKIYAAEAADLGLGLTTFLAISVPARLSRFALATVLAGAASRLARRRWTLRTVRIVHVGFWVAFYGWFFWFMGR